MRSGIVIRVGVAADAVQIADVQIKSWRYAYRGVIEQAYFDAYLDRGVRGVGWLKTLTQKPEGLLLAFDGRILAGFAFAEKSRDNHYKDYAELYAIYLDPDYIGRGIGAALFKRASEYAARRGFKRMFAKVLVDNKVGRDFYERMGAVVIDGSEEEEVIGGKAYLAIKYAWETLGC